MTEPDIQGFFIYNGGPSTVAKDTTPSIPAYKQQPEEKKQETEDSIVGVVIITTNSQKKWFTYSPITQNDLDNDTEVNNKLRDLLRNNNYSDLEKFDYKQYFKIFMDKITGMDINESDFFKF